MILLDRFLLCPFGFVLRLFCDLFLELLAFFVFRSITAHFSIQFFFCWWYEPSELYGAVAPDTSHQPCLRDRIKMASGPHGLYEESSMKHALDINRIKGPTARIPSAISQVDALGRPVPLMTASGQTEPSKQCSRQSPTVLLQTPGIPQDASPPAPNPPCFTPEPHSAGNRGGSSPYRAEPATKPAIPTASHP